VCSPFCLACVHLVETVLANRSITWEKGWTAESERLGQPLNTLQKVRWVRTWLPVTATMMDLDGLIRSAEREPASQA
jgi:hypothetical protein